MELLSVLVDLGQSGGALEPSPQELRRWDGGTWEGGHTGLEIV